MKEIGKIILFVVVIVGVIMGATLLSSFFFEGQAQNLFAAGVATGLIISLYFLFSRHFYGEFPPDTDLVKSFKNPQYITFGLLVGSVMVLATFLISKSTGAITTYFMADYMTAYYVFLFTAAYSALGSAIWEEIVFRGFVLGKLEKQTSQHVASVGVALIFGLLHLLSPIKSVEIVLSTFLAGLFLNYSFLKTRNLLFVIAIHFSWNFLTSVLYNKRFMNVEFSGSLSGKTSPEEGIVAMSVIFLGLLFALFVLPRYANRHKSN